MPGKRVSMRKLREVLRLDFELKLGQRQIARTAKTLAAILFLNAPGRRVCSPPQNVK